MTHENKNFVYLHCLILPDTAEATACDVRRFGHFLCSDRSKYTAVCYSSNASVMGVLSAVCWIRQLGRAHRFFRAHKSKKTHKS